MTTRKEYIDNLKNHLDQWNDALSQWEAKSRTAKTDARIEYEMRLEALRKQRDEAAAKLKELQGSSEDAWKDLATGFDSAWASMREAFDKATSHFHK